MGGEPFLYKHIKELLLYTKKLNILTTVTTNGTVLTKEIIEILKICDNVTPVISIQSMNDRSNSKLMGVSSNTILYNIQNLLKEKISCRLNTVYTEQTYTEMKNLIDFAYKNDYILRISIAFYIHKNPQNIIKSSRNLLDFRVLEEKNFRHVSNNYNVIKYSFESCMKYSAYPEYAKTQVVVNEFQKNDYGCNAGRTKLEILSNGDVYPCVAFEGYLTPTSNITQNDIDYIWKKDVFLNTIRNYVNTNIDCTKCNYYVLCNGGCPARNLMNNDKLNVEYKDELCAMLQV